MKGANSMGHYITEIHIDKLRHLSDVYIKIRDDKRTHLLLTGKNGSGKTTLLNAIKQYLQSICDNNFHNIDGEYQRLLEIYIKNMETAKTEDKKYQEQKNYERFDKIIKNYKNGIQLNFNDSDGLERLYREGKFLIAFYSADRKTRIEKSSTVEDIVLDVSYPLDSNPSNLLLKYLVHLKTQQAYARNEDDMRTVDMLTKWFSRFEDALKVLLDNKSITLNYDYRNYKFEILEDGRDTYGLDQLSDGYSAVIQVVADIILRMEQNWLKKSSMNSYDIEGIVLIDELETHLHISLQKKILVFLTEFFPNIQFIISTHSPYILNSVDECVIYDLENKLRMEDMSGYSAEGIVEGYFGFDSYSELLLEKINRYEKLAFKENPTDEEKSERARIFTEMKQLSGDLSKEAKDAFEDIESRRKNNGKIQS